MYDIRNTYIGKVIERFNWFGLCKHYQEIISPENVFANKITKRVTKKRKVKNVKPSS